MSFVTVLLTACVLAGCQSRPIDDPVAEALTPTLTSSRRVAAVRATPPEQAFELMPLVLSSRHPIAVRREAVEQMIRADADAFWLAAARDIRRVDDWPMITLLAEQSAADQRNAFVPALVQSWARPSVRYTDDARPERLAIAQLAPGQAVGETLWAQFAAPPTDPQARRVTQAAWAVLRRTQDRDTLRDLLLESPATHALHQQLARVAPAVDELPRDREELLRMQTLIASSTVEDWQRRREVLRLHPAAPGQPGVSLRHLPAIDHAAILDRGQADRSAMLADLSRRLAAARHVSRGASDSSQANIRSTPDTLADHAEALGWADLLVVQALLDALDDAGLVASLFRQAEVDRLDRETELGGILTWNADGQPVAQTFAPLMRRHDEIYIASDDCIEAMHTGLAHYHFHAQRHDNADWAGPGGGDFTFANNLHANCIVFTFIGRDTLNVDIYFPGEVVIDLGCIHR